MKDEQFDFYSPTNLKSYNLEQTMKYQIEVLGQLDMFTRRHSETYGYKIHCILHNMWICT